MLRSIKQVVRTVQSYHGNSRIHYYHINSRINLGCSHHQLLSDSNSIHIKSSPRKYLSTTTAQQQDISSTEKLEFQAETRQLLDIVAKSLYSEREVFLRELISNSTDALEKVRYLQLGQDVDIRDAGLALNITVEVNETLNTLTIQDNGIGMTREELINCLGTIARSGSKEFVKAASSVGGSDSTRNIIGQFGVGFYSAFMVGDNVTVMTRSAKQDDSSAGGWVWRSDGAGSYEISEGAGISRGTKIVIQLKPDALEYCSKDRIREVLKKHCNFVSYPIYMDSVQMNTVEPLWARKASEISDEEHRDFYQSISGRKDNPMYTLQFKVETPVNIQCLLYIPAFMPQMDMSQMGNFGISLYCRKVMVQSQSVKLLPEWLMFLQGVVDSEDIPLNLSRELLQESVVLSKIKSVITGKAIAYLNRQAKRDPTKYEEFYKEFGRFLRIGLVTTESQTEREDIAKLLRFESNKEEAGVSVSLDNYLDRAEPGQKHIYYLSAPSRELALQSPYYETLAGNDLEVLFSYNKEDDVVLFKLDTYNDRRLCSAESANVSRPKTKEDSTDAAEDKLDKKTGDRLSSWMRDALGRENVKEVKMSDRQHSQPAVVTVENLTQLRRYLEMAPPEQREASYKYLLHNNVTLQLNPAHPIVQKLSVMKDTNPAIAQLVALQLFDNALINADLIHDPRRMVSRLNQILEVAVQTDVPEVIVPEVEQ